MAWAFPVDAVYWDQRPISASGAAAAAVPEALAVMRGMLPSRATAGVPVLAASGDCRALPELRFIIAAAVAVAATGRASRVLAVLVAAETVLRIQGQLPNRALTARMVSAAVVAAAVLIRRRRLALAARVATVSSSSDASFLPKGLRLS